MRYTISKDFHFSAAHHLVGVPNDHPCRRPHGHNYVVRLVLAADEVDARGFVVDYNELAAFKRYIDAKLDHRDLNQVLPDLHGNTTAENIALHLYEWAAQRWPETWAVAVSETPKTWATYTERDA